VKVSFSNQTLLQNYEVAMEQLENLQREKSLLADTPTGELRDQVKSLSNTVESLSKKGVLMRRSLASS
jgi:hypothetical protein